MISHVLMFVLLAAPSPTNLNQARQTYSGCLGTLLKTNLKPVQIESSVPVNTLLSGFLATPGIGVGMSARSNQRHIAATRTHQAITGPSRCPDVSRRDRHRRRVVAPLVLRWAASKLATSQWTVSWLWHISTNFAMRAARVSGFFAS